MSAITPQSPSNNCAGVVPLALDRDIFKPDAEQLAFFKQTTGIQDDDEVKAHIIGVQEAAYQIYPYPCIRNFNFTKLKISHLPAYPQMLTLSKSRQNAIYLDLGCCFGNDPRKAVLDGYPMEDIICSDIQPQFWELGFKLFRDKETFHVPFVAGDVFDPNFLSPTLVERTGQRPALLDVKNLTELQGQISVIHASAFFHLFDMDKQALLAQLTANLLLKQPGSFIFGSHVGRQNAGLWSGDRGWGHSAESWKELWEGVLGEGKCDVQAKWEKWMAPVPWDPNGESVMLTWSVTLI